MAIQLCLETFFNQKVEGNLQFEAYGLKNRSEVLLVKLCEAEVIEGKLLPK